jgi:hypothetical protein
MAGNLITCVVNSFLNAANIIVLTRRNMVTSFNVILTWLAVADNLKMLDYLIFAIEFYILKDPKLSLLNTYSTHAANYNSTCNSVYTIDILTHILKQLLF